MDESNRRPVSRRDTAVSRERPRNTRGPQPPRRQTGTASEQARARRERLAARENPAAEAPVHTVPQARDPQTRRSPERSAREKEQGASGREKEQRKSAAQKPAQKRKRRKPRRVYNTNFGFKFVTMLAVVGVIVLAMMIFFKIKHVDVQNFGTDGKDILAGSDETAPIGDPASDTSGQTPGTGRHSYYSKDEIIQASGINIDDNLLSLSKASVASRIHAALPYINEIQIKKKLPNTVIITVTEFTVTYGIQDEQGGWWLISREGRVLEHADEKQVNGHLIVAGMPIQVPEIGDYIKPAAADGADLSEIAAKQTATLAVLPQLEQSPFAEQIVGLDVSTSYDIIIWYGTQCQIRLGNTENLSYKLNYLDSVLKELGKDKSGTIDLTFTDDDGAHFLPFG